MDKTFQTVCVTGHRTQYFNLTFNESDPLIKWVKSVLAQTVKKLIKLETKTFISGGAIGVDTWFAEIILWYRDYGDYPHIELVIAKPFPSQDALWNIGTKIRYEKICNRANRVEILQPDPYIAWKMHHRNVYMVKQSDLCIAVLDSRKMSAGVKSGTGHCYRQALLYKIPIIHIDPYLKNVELIVPQKKGKI